MARNCQIDADAAELDCKSLEQLSTGRIMSRQGGQSYATPVSQLLPQPVQATEEELGVTSAGQLEATTREPKSNDSQVISADNPEVTTLNKGKKRMATDFGIEPKKCTNHPPSSLTIIDKFCTPANRIFYEKSPYSQLDILKQEIRLIQLLPAKENEPLEINLINGCFLNPDLLDHSYCAISYCAGDPQNTELIKVNGLDFNAFASLGFALRQVLRARSRGGLRGCPKLIWADQICINQSDPQERSRQVSLMKRIFRTATEVLVSLGEDSNNGLWTKMMIQLCQSIKVQGAPRLLNDIPPVEFKETAVWIANRFLDDFKNPSFQAKWKAFVEIFSRPWWGRGWIYQEVIVSQKVTLILGDGMADWDLFSKATQLAHEIFATHVRAVYMDPDLLDDHDSRVIISAIRGFDDIAVLSLVEGRAKWRTKQVLDLKELLEHSRQRKVSDRRDGVFAFIGLADPGYGIVPDYTADLQTIFRQTCKRIILHERSLSILFHSQERERQLTLPSWVPDWSSQTTRNSLSRSGMPFRASSDHPSAAAFDSNEPDNPDTILRVQCLIVDQVANENGMGLHPESNHSETKGPVFEDWARVAGGADMVEFIRAVALSDNIEEEDEESDRRFIKPRSTYFNGELLWDAFFCTLHRGFDDETRQDERRRLAKVSMDGDWIFFRSPKGYIGLADSRAMPTDCICVLLGATVPLILRHQENHYVLIGEAYVHGFMYGEAIEMMKSGSLEVKTIDIF